MPPLGTGTVIFILTVQIPLGPSPIAQAEGLCIMVQALRWYQDSVEVMLQISPGCLCSNALPHPGRCFYIRKRVPVYLKRKMD